MDRISARGLSRATLARQMLLARADRPVVEAIEHLCGLQAQLPNPPYFGLWSRLRDFDPAELSKLIEDREVVRIAAMRSTVHLMTAADALELRAVVQPALERGLRATVFGRELVSEAVDIDELTAAGRALMDAAPRTGARLGSELRPRWPGLQPLTIQNALRVYLALVQVPPRGLWGRSGQPTLTTVETWLGRSVAAQPSLDRMVLRYLAAFGPATIADVQAWSGLTRLAEVVERLDGLVRLTGPTGAALYDLPDAPRPDPDTLAPARLLAEFDNLTLGYADRTRVLSDDDRRRAYAANGIIPGMIMVDGVVTGVWKLRTSKTAARLELRTFRRIPASQRADVTAEAEAMLAFAAQPARPEIDWVDVSG